MIRIDSLHKYFNKGRQNEIHVINNVSLELPEKGMVAIFGKSGCGKTTLLNVIGGLDRYASGSLTIEGREVRKDTDDIRNRYTGFIFQNYNLQVTETNYENVANALRLCGMKDEEEIRRRVTAALENVGMEKFATRTPDTLSGGQQQRIAIARAIVKNPRIILADEPTGNLDEANTIMIMDLLKQIAKDHLVLLVTHEASLVDYYCDMVVELQDGRIVNTRSNASAGGYTVRDKNHIYLGELERDVLEDNKASIEYYGEQLEEPLKLVVVNHGGKLYLRVDTPKVQLLDATSEVVLKEGVFEETGTVNSVSESIDMSALLPVEGEVFGRLFGWKSAIKSGYASCFGKKKRSMKLLRRCMMIFAAVLVFMTAVFGTSFADILNVKEQYNSSLFYVNTPNSEVYQRLEEALKNPESGFDKMTLSPSKYYSQGEAEEMYFSIGNFETFETSMYFVSFMADAIILPMSWAEELEVVVGKTEGIQSQDVVITTKVADQLLENSAFGYIKEYEDLLGIVTDTYTVDRKQLRVVGVVESDEVAMYVQDEFAVEMAIANAGTKVVIADQELQSGELVFRDVENQPDAPKVGDTVKLHGMDFTVKSIIRQYKEYETWLEANGYEKLGEWEYFLQLAEEELNALLEEEGADKDALLQAWTEEDWINNRASELQVERGTEYLVYYYEYIDQFFQDMYSFRKDIYELWLAFEKDVPEAAWAMISEDYYGCVKYHELHGRYPSFEELYDAFESGEILKSYDYLAAVYDKFYYEFEDLKYYDSGYYGNYIDSYMISEEDCKELGRRYGDTDSRAMNSQYTGYWEYNPETGEEYYVSTETVAYMVLHSTDPEKSETYMKEHFSDLKNPDTGYRWEFKAVITPDVVFDELIKAKQLEIITGLISMAVCIVAMSLCMFFIMRSTLLNRIKEVGIYRAIGVSKKNLTFRFTVEAGVLAATTVFMGYLVASAFVWVIMKIASGVSEVFFYPWWYALITLAFLLVITLLCGILPIRSLLRKTPAEILAKYDI